MPLILTRAPGQSVKVGDNILVTVTAVRGTNVRLAFDCPRSIKISRTDKSFVPQPTESEFYEWWVAHHGSPPSADETRLFAYAQSAWEASRRST